MVRPTQPMMARLRLTTKQVNGGYYKGNRTGSTGYFAKNGSYVIDWKKVRTYVVPEGLKEFKLTPFVTKLMPPTPSKYTQEIERQDKLFTVETSLGAKDFLELWASDNGAEVREEERRAEEAKRLAAERAEARKVRGEEFKVRMEKQREENRAKLEEKRAAKQAMREETTAKQAAAERKRENIRLREFYIARKEAKRLAQEKLMEEARARKAAGRAIYAAQQKRRLEKLAMWAAEAEAAKAAEGGETVEVKKVEQAEKPEVKSEKTDAKDSTKPSQ
ncbi:hypothetical protein BJY04DRAFT_178250 [Aspergillus karnatakaensis]|uniref:mitochondrial 54S ribosomal protein mL41 n=1 Tax=Aspergillus karnatakaensis TaxID=1810916 RepID=UPI003CCDA863